MVPLNMTYLHCLQHSLFEHLFNIYFVIKCPGRVHYSLEIECQAPPPSLLSDYLILDKYQRP